MKANVKQIGLEMEGVGIILEKLKSRSVFISYRNTYDLGILVNTIKSGLIDCKADKNWLDDIINVRIDYSDRFTAGISAYKEFVGKRQSLLTDEISDVERRLILAVETATAMYEESGDCRFYVKFTQALQAYKTWIDRKIYKVKLYIVHLQKLLTGNGIRFDFRAKFRTIMRFLFKNLDDYHGAGNNDRYIINSFNYCQISNQHESSIYRISYQ